MASGLSRIDREKQTVEKMINIYCKGHGHPGDKRLCEDCTELLTYALKKLDICPFGDEKTSCRKCAVHCYEPSNRKKVREVMRYSGPKMLFRHPIIAFYHIRQESKNRNRGSEK